MRAGEDGDERIVELLDRSVPDGLLLNADVFLDGVKELERTNLDAESGERGVRRVVLSRLWRACHVVPPENEEQCKSHHSSVTYGSKPSLFCTKLRYVWFAYSGSRLSAYK